MAGHRRVNGSLLSDPSRKAAGDGVAKRGHPCAGEGAAIVVGQDELDCAPGQSILLQQIALGQGMETLPASGGGVQGMRKLDIGSPPALDGHSGALAAPDLMALGG